MVNMTDKQDKVSETEHKTMADEEMAFLKAVQDKFKFGNFLERYTEYIDQTKLNILIIGGSGVGKSSTIKALLKDDTQESNASLNIGTSHKPTTMEIQKYKISKNITIYDSPGLGDGVKDEEHKKKILKLLQKETKKKAEISGLMSYVSFPDNDDALIDLALILVDATSRDYASAFESIKIVGEAMEPEDRSKRILVAMNKCDKSDNPEARMDYEKREPNELLKAELDEKIKVLKERIKENTGIDIDPIYFSAGYEGKNPYNIDKLFYYIQKNLPKRKVVVINKKAQKEVYEGDYGDKNKSGFWDGLLKTVEDVLIATLGSIATKGFSWLSNLVKKF